MHDGPHDFDRRSFLRLASSVGLAAAAPQTVAEVANAADGDWTGHNDNSVDVPHVLNRPDVRARLDEFDRTGDPTAKYEPALRRTLEESRRQTFDLLVRTAGTSESVTTKRYGLEVSGWRPRSTERATLSDYGTVGYVPDFTSTTVTLYDVAESDVEALADEDAVASIGALDPVGNDAPEMESVSSGGDAIDPDVIASASFANFDAASSHYSLDEPVRIGVVDDGYQGDDASIFAESYAETIGGVGAIDESLAENFVDDGGGWDRENDSTHGDDVADLIAYLLDDPHENAIVPLRVIPGNASCDWQDNMRAALEYALEHDVDVLNVSAGCGKYTTCPGIYCQELWAYANAGYVAVGTSGNGTGAFAREIGGSRYTVGVGGVEDGNCGWKRLYDGNYYTGYAGSTYATVDYDECPFCSDSDAASSQFVPDVYAAGKVASDDPDSSASVAGTSFAAPQVTAAAATMQSNGLYSFWSAKDLFRKMTETTVCPDDAAQHGEVLDAEYAAWASDYITDRGGHR